MLSRGCYPTSMPSIHSLVAKGDIDGLLRLLAQAQDAKQLVNEPDEYGYSPLFQAVKDNRPDLAEVLLKAGADPEFVRVQQLPGL